MTTTLLIQPADAAAAPRIYTALHNLVMKGKVNGKFDLLTSTILPGHAVVVGEVDNTDDYPTCLAAVYTGAWQNAATTNLGRYVPVDVIVRSDTFDGVQHLYRLDTAGRWETDYTEAFYRNRADEDTTPCC